MEEAANKSIFTPFHLTKQKKLNFFFIWFNEIKFDWFHSIIKKENLLFSIKGEGELNELFACPFMLRFQLCIAGEWLCVSGPIKLNSILSSPFPFTLSLFFLLSYPLKPKSMNETINFCWLWNELLCGDGLWPITNKQ